LKAPTTAPTKVNAAPIMVSQSDKDIGEILQQSRLSGTAQRESAPFEYPRSSS
jgi:hypothetical protein